MKLTLEVQNGFSFPKEAALLNEEIRDMGIRLEETTDFTEEDTFLAAAFAGDFNAPDDDGEIEPWFAETVAEFSQDFPDLVFAMDLSDEYDLDNPIVARWYFKDGKRQIVHPYQVVPEFDEDGTWEAVK